MPLTRDFKETVMADMRDNPEFRRGMLREGIDSLLAEELDVAKEILRDYVNATMGFDGLSAKVGIPPKSLMRMLGPNGNPQMSNLFAVIAALREDAGIAFEVSVAPDSKRRARAPKGAGRKRTPAAAPYPESTSQPRLEFAEAPAKFRRK